MQQNAINMQANNELAKPMAANADNPYAANNPYDTNSRKDSFEMENYQAKGYVPQQQVIIIEADPQNVDWH